MTSCKTNNKSKAFKKSWISVDNCWLLFLLSYFTIMFTHQILQKSIVTIFVLRMAEWESYSFFLLAMNSAEIVWGVRYTCKSNSKWANSCCDYLLKILWYELIWKNTWESQIFFGIFRKLVLEIKALLFFF